MHGFANLPRFNYCIFIGKPSIETFLQNQNGKIRSLGLVIQNHVPEAL